MRVLLFQLDGKLPNIALMRLAAHHRGRGDTVELRRAGNFAAIEPHFDDNWDRVYGSAIFERSRGLAEALTHAFPGAIVGGTGVDKKLTLESIGVPTRAQDYSDYPGFRMSMGFTQRGCRLKCSFCVVPQTEGAVQSTATIAEIWRGDPYPREVLLLDNDFFGQVGWRDRIDELRAGRFKVSFNQGVNCRMIGDEEAAALASVDYRADNMRDRRLYTAWDSKGDERRLFRGLELLAKYGVKPDHLMVYILIGYWSNETAADREYRRARLREFGARPYPMPYLDANTTAAQYAELRGFQRWVIGAYDKRIAWREWVAANYRPENLGCALQSSLA